MIKINKIEKITKQLSNDLAQDNIYGQLTQIRERELIYDYQSGNTQQIKDNAHTLLLNSYIRNIIYLLFKYDINDDYYNDILSECIFSVRKSLQNYNLNTHHTPFVLFYKKNIIHTINGYLNKENKHKKNEVNSIFIDNKGCLDTSDLIVYQENNDDKEYIQLFINNKLKPQEKLIYSLFFENDMSVKQISKQLHKTPERIRQIKRQIINKGREFIKKDK